MCVIIPSWCRIHRISLGLVYINARPCHIIRFYRCSYTCIRIQLNVPPSLFTYLDKSICCVIPSWCSIHWISLGLVYITTRPCRIIWFFRCSYTCIRIQLNVSPSLFRYLDKSICFIIPSWCSIHWISLGLVYITTRPCHIIWFFRCSYTCIRIQLNVSPSLFRYLDKSICCVIPSWCSIHWISLGLVYITTRPCHVIWFYCWSYTGISIQCTVSPTLFHISR
jgi:hypothetical protein